MCLDYSLIMGKKRFYTPKYRGVIVLSTIQYIVCAKIAQVIDPFVPLTSSYYLQQLFEPPHFCKKRMFFIKATRDFWTSVTLTSSGVTTYAI